MPPAVWWRIDLQPHNHGFERLSLTLESGVTAESRLETRKAANWSEWKWFTSFCCPNFGVVNQEGSLMAFNEYP